MNELTTLGLNVLLLIVAWRVVCKPALRHFVRDKLFDAREDLRDYFEEHSDLNHPAYCYLRNLLNHHIRFIEDQSLIKMIYFGVAISNDKSTEAYIHRRFNEIEKDCGDFAPIMQEYRKKANRWLKFYLIHSSFCLSFTFYLTVSVAVLCALPGALTHARRQNKKIARITYVKKVDASFDDDIVESYRSPCKGELAIA